VVDGRPVFSRPAEARQDAGSANGEGVLAKIGRALSVRKANANGVHRRATVSGPLRSGQPKSRWG